MSFNTKGLMTSNDQTWKTPKKIYDYYAKLGFFDVCPGIDIFNGLIENWERLNFCNPPYNNIEKWVDKAIQEKNKGNYTVMLIPSRTDTQWFKKIVMSGAKIVFIEGRLKFNDCNTFAPFPSMSVHFTKYLNHFVFEYMTRDLLRRVYGLC